MEVIKIRGNQTKLNGKIKIASAKNSVLPLLACAIMSSGEITLKNCKPLTDIVAMINIIKQLGGVAKFDGNNLIVNCKNVNFAEINSNLTCQIRSSIFLLGPILARFGKRLCATRAVAK